MISNTRNRADILRQRIVSQLQPTRSAATAITPISGGVASQRRGLTWTDSDGNPREWFVWGRHSFDSEKAVFQ